MHTRESERVVLMKKLFLAAIVIYGIRCMVFSEGFYIDGGISMNMATYGQSINSFIDNYVDHIASTELFLAVVLPPVTELHLVYILSEPGY
jgi:hypothetical protein